MTVRPGDSLLGRALYPAIGAAIGAGLALLLLGVGSWRAALSVGLAVFAVLLVVQGLGSGRRPG